MTALAALTFAVFTCGFFLGAAALASWYSDHALVVFFTQPYARAGRGWRWLWAVPHRFARKLWFALLMAAWPFSAAERAASLALLVFVSLLVLLALALRLRPYADPRDNQLEVACLLLLMYGYFVSALPGSSAGMGASVTVLQVALLLYGAQRWLRQRLAQRPSSAHADAAERTIGGGRTGSDTDRDGAVPGGVDIDDDEALAMAMSASCSRPGPAAGQYRDSASELAAPLIPTAPCQPVAAAVDV
jgi:hypothetical protein